jgi:hypothetical protein
MKTRRMRVARRTTRKKCTCGAAKCRTVSDCCDAGVIFRRGTEVDSVYIFFVAFLRNLSWFKLSRHAQNLDPEEDDKQENRMMMMIGWGGAISFHVPLNNKPENNKCVLVLNDDNIARPICYRRQQQQQVDSLLCSVVYGFVSFSRCSLSLLRIQQIDHVIGRGDRWMRVHSKRYYFPRLG